VKAIVLRLAPRDSRYFYCSIEEKGFWFVYGQALHAVHLEDFYVTK